MKCPFVIRMCPQCKRLLVLYSKNFNKDKNKKYGFSYKCKDCKNVYDRKKNGTDLNKPVRTKGEKKYNHKEYCRRYHQEHKEEIHARHKKYREENKEYLSNYRKEYNKKTDYDKKYHQEHKEEIHARHKEYREENPHISFNNTQKRRLREKNQGNGISKEQWIEMMNFFEWKCAYSGLSLDKNNRSIDHIIPISKNGENEIWNMCPMIKTYNSSKYTNDMEEWYIEQEYFDIDRLLKIYNWMEYAFKKWGEKQT